MSDYIKVYATGGNYGLGWLGKNNDADKLVEQVAKPVLAQHIPDDGRLDAALQAITDALWTFIRFERQEDAKDPDTESTDIRKGDLSEARTCCKEAILEVLGRLKEQAVTKSITDLELQEHQTGDDEFTGIPLDILDNELEKLDA